MCSFILVKIVLDLLLGMGMTLGQRRCNYFERVWVVQ